MPGKNGVNLWEGHEIIIIIFSCRLYSSPAVTVPYIDNEPVLQFAPGSDERAAVEKVGSCIKCKLIDSIDLLDTIDNKILTSIIYFCI